MNKKVFVVLVTYNGAHWIDKNIQSLLDSRYPVSIIAIDNNSTDASAALLSKYPQVDLIQSPENLGFGKANNIGMKRALEQGADYVFLLNQDAWVFEETIEGLLYIMETKAEFGILSPLHFSPDINLSLDDNFKIYLGRVTSRIDSVNIVPFVNAAAWMLSRKCIETVGYFEPLFGHYGEDRNYCDKVRYHKFKIGIDGGTRIVHDRVITRNFNKDIIQSKYKILTSLLDINRGLAKSYLQGLKEVIGLPKYFMKSYGLSKSATMFFTLLRYYMSWIGEMGKIQTARNNAK
ncbi:glycosyltransferase family 2 protein [Flavobacterium sp. DG1-102-2]|uniref:glycosyltransferase family 2 protein n=1 Tax=Flavobacterium sp. DG1-102-2 TaxID=3081663 RepID=UPI002949C376|nr:glycosyltransferase family 2 protein [Flavobacterium sp. DG1-102-2]MDV6168257.1 glycosyltransferase family 2 protein [Flavobacterium sp. DG1-102-2]